MPKKNRDIFVGHPVCVSPWANLKSCLEGSKFVMSQLKRVVLNNSCYVVLISLREFRCTQHVEFLKFSYFRMVWPVVELKTSSLTYCLVNVEYIRHFSDDFLSYLQNYFLIHRVEPQLLFAMRQKLFIIPHTSLLLWYINWFEGYIGCE